MCVGGNCECVTDKANVIQTGALDPQSSPYNPEKKHSAGKAGDRDSHLYTPLHSLTLSHDGVPSGSIGSGVWGHLGLPGLKVSYGGTQGSHTHGVPLQSMLNQLAPLFLHTHSYHTQC